MTSEKSVATREQPSFVKSSMTSLATAAELDAEPVSSRSTGAADGV